MRSFFTFVLRMNQCLNLIAHQVEPRILGNLSQKRSTKMETKPTKLQMKESTEKTWICLLMQWFLKLMKPLMQNTKIRTTNQFTYLKMVSLVNTFFWTVS